MEEKKLTDEEIVKALEIGSKCCEHNYLEHWELVGVCQNALDLIYRLQNEVSQWKSKAEHIEEVYNADREHFIKTTTEQKAEIERLTEENRVVIHNMDFHRNKKFELQKQVDELTEELEKAYEIERANIQAEIADAGTSCHWCQNVTVKDTAKEIFTDIDDLTLCIIGGSNEFKKGYFQAITDMKTAIKDLLKEKYTVEVK